MFPGEYLGTRIKQSGEGEFYLYEFYGRHDSAQPVMSAEVDPRRGYIFTSLRYDNTFLSETDYIRYYWTAEYREAAAGIWLPHAIEVTDERPGFKSIASITVRQWTINEPIPDSRFTWQDLEYPESQAVIIHHDGRKEGVTVGALARALPPEKPYTGPNWVRVSDSPPASALPPQRPPAPHGGRRARGGGSDG